MVIGRAGCEQPWPSESGLSGFSSFLRGVLHCGLNKTGGTGSSITLFVRNMGRGRVSLPLLDFVLFWICCEAFLQSSDTTVC